MSRATVIAAAAATLLLSNTPSSHAGEVPYSALPIPVKAFILMTAVEYGVKSPESMRSNEDYDDQIPGIANSDLNQDGSRDYFVALCMFNERVREFWSNGYPCNSGALIISNAYGGYQFMPTQGLLIAAKAGQDARVVIRERQFDDVCDDYVCDIEYQIARPSDEAQYASNKLRVCLPDQC